ncbi:hypothetical protein Q4493_09415 [Colwellia sp. 1_MG-2023]|uniref:hypothetical protein n=1 Tax=Colwellia sp. 1_MG-2023 TaxID=3062649 RepID=UPI0026E40FB5|nr:hypothetical protein [Colwellia sp. 1_MG-2023]MDO6445990.1 hypothetical protein [Colwellia sp. 1_MG-2023]
MESQLPISIKVNSLLSEEFSTLESIANRLESQLNFQTMTAGWYGDENNILNLCVSIESPEKFYDISIKTHSTVKSEFADDVIYLPDQMNNLHSCFVAITDVEQRLLCQHPKLLASFLDKKLIKVLNLIATELNFPPI